MEIHRLNYIGSKFQLLEWLTDIIKGKTGYANFNGKVVADLFAGTGIVTHHFRTEGATTISNDAELYSAIITSAFGCSIYSDKVKALLTTFNDELLKGDYKGFAGYITMNYSPLGPAKRQFFTEDNARRIDYLRRRLEQERSKILLSEYTFLLASLLLSADAVSNVPAVYGCYLKNFKAKALKSLVVQPIHTNTIAYTRGSRTYNMDVLSDTLLSATEADIVYLDPPYNERQYSKNYFPLNMIALTPDEQDKQEPLKGKTGIPTDCFISPFCKKGATVEASFEKLFSTLKAKWIFMSYNSESLVSKEKMLILMRKYGEASVVERDYKRFKSFEYNEDKEIKEYLFCLKKHAV